MARRQWRQILPLAAAVLAFAISGGLGGSGFIAAFVGGMAFGRVSSEHGAATLFTEETGGLLASLVWIGFGALALGPASRTSPGRSCSTPCSA